MKAVRIHRFGDESVLQYEDAPDPVVGPEDVLIRVRAASVNRGDLGRRAGTSAAAPPALPLIIGWDVAGDVVATGAGVGNVRVGQRVVMRLTAGGYAELAAAPAAVAVPLPVGVSYEQAASLPVVFLTAWVALLDTAKLKAGETALVQSAGSGVGMAGVQIAKHVAGARVFTTAGTDEKVAKARELGADVAINYTTQDFLPEVLRLTEGRGVQVALDMVGGDVFARSQKALAEGGRLVSVGRSSGVAPEVDTALAEAKHQQVVTGWGLGSLRTPEQAAQDLAKIVDLVAQGTLKTIIDRVYPLSEAAEAHRYLANRAQFGKIILVP
ncbi:MAG TPA: zinc-binding dehydrogenase [Dehalococcoidia bacterium]|nr:zinc-binding dehydrogenase [Dehalococcoidia bacterium]